MSASLGILPSACHTAGATLANQMDAAVRTALAILAAMSLATFEALDMRFDAFAVRLDTHLDRHAT